MAVSVRDPASEREVSLEIDPSKVWHDTRLVSCAQCRQPMVRRTIEGIEIDECTECGVYWFDQGELGAVLEARTRTTLESLGPRRAPLQSRERCPVCLRSTQMHRFNHVPQVAVDVCTDHGNWLDQWQGRELYLWGCKDAKQIEVAQTAPYRRRFDRLRTRRAVFIALSMYGLKATVLAPHVALSIVVLAFWFKDLVELFVLSRGSSHPTAWSEKEQQREVDQTRNRWPS